MAYHENYSKNPSSHTLQAETRRKIILLAQVSNTVAEAIPAGHLDGHQRFPERATFCLRPRSHLRASLVECLPDPPRVSRACFFDFVLGISCSLGDQLGRSIQCHRLALFVHLSGIHCCRSERPRLSKGPNMS
jgi:hypothetical protein